MEERVKSEISLPSLPTVKELFEESLGVFKGSVLRLFLLAIVSLVVVGVLGFIAVSVFIALGVGTNLFASIQKAGPAALNAIPFNTYLVGGLAVLVLFVVYLVLAVAINAAGIIVVSEYDCDLNLGSAIKRGLAFVIPLSFLGSIVFILEFGGFFVFIFPALIFAFLFMFAAYEVVLGGQSFYNGLKRSLLIVSKRFGDILVRILAFALVYVFIAFLIPGVLRNIASEAAPFVGLVSFFVNMLLGWYGICYLVTLYKQARAGFEGKEGAGMRWVWLVAGLGWVIAAFVGIFVFNMVRESSVSRVKNQYQQEMYNKDFNIDKKIIDY